MACKECKCARTLKEVCKLACPEKNIKNKIVKAQRDIDTVRHRPRMRSALQHDAQLFRANMLSIPSRSTLH